MSQFAPRFIFPLTVISTAAFILFTESAKADMSTETFGTTGYFGSAGDSNLFALPTFNTNLGTLESVDVTLQFNICPIYTTTNGTTSPITFTNFTLNVPLSVTGLGSTNYDTTMISTLAAGTAYPGVHNFILDRTSTTGNEGIAGTDFSLWENSTNQKIALTVDKGALTASGTAASPGVTFAGSSTQWANISVEYAYLSSTVAAPEPSGRYLAGLVASAMTLLFVARRKISRA